MKAAVPGECAGDRAPRPLEKSIQEESPPPPVAGGLMRLSRKGLNEPRAAIWVARPLDLAIVCGTLVPRCLLPESCRRPIWRSIGETRRRGGWYRGARMQGLTKGAGENARSAPFSGVIWKPPRAAARRPRAR